ncbi:DUF5074 domain-containing protein [Halosquirtibacter laminarini]|uniref:DUF5074 domain-containing protein n=1 Tax=Halosquirtibacter laminarini TaxID=3374600 RepID=A0AC61NBQ0_9BACT|nr:DUF5074 domain-containing protein [Prolixibacteraceae bacterium]
MKITRILSVLLLLTTLFVSCSEETEKKPSVPGKYSNSVYILNEGPYGDPTASSISVYNPVDQEVENQVFKTANKDIGSDGLILGNLPQSMTQEGELIHIIVNGDNKIFTINGKDARYYGKTTGVTSPRYMVTLPDHSAFVTSLGVTELTKVDLVQKEFDEGKVLDKIDLTNPDITKVKQHTTEQIIATGDQLFTNAWSYDNKILVIDPKTRMLTDSITVGIQPQSIALDKNKKLWVLCDGSWNGNPYATQTAGSIYRIDTKTNKVEWSYQFPTIGAQKKNLCINGSGDTLYFINKDVYRIKIDQTEPEKVIEAKAGQTFYGMGIDPKNGDIYIGDAIDYAQDGMVYRYNKNLESVDNFKVGILPNSFLFYYN